MTPQGIDSFYQPMDETMFDSNVVEQIHERHETKVLAVQNQVSSEFDVFKRLAKSFWKEQRFEDVVLGRFTFSFALINQAIAESHLPRNIKEVTVCGTEAGQLVLQVTHARRGLYVLNLTIKDIVFAEKTLRVEAVLNDVELPNGSWLARKRLALTFKLGRFALHRLCRNLKFMTVTPSMEKNEYVFDFSQAVTSVLRDHHIDMDMVHLRSWRILKDQLAFQGSVNAARLATYLKRRMPSLFD